MKHSVRAFSVGLITAGLILLGVFYLSGEANNGQAEYSTEEMVTKLEEDGFRVITEKEYISYSVATSQSNSDDADDAEEEPDKEIVEEDETEDDNNSEDEEQTEETSEEEVEEKEEEQTPSTITITVEPGMASSHISQMLEDRGIVDDADDFNRYLLDHDYSLRIQMGDHELETGMSHYEIAERLTN